MRLGGKEIKEKFLKLRGNEQKRKKKRKREEMSLET